MKILRAFAVAAGLALVVVSLGAQEAAKYGADPNYKVPRLADGRPDLQGVWGNNSVTPMTRPRQWKDRTVITDAELNEIKQLAAQSVDQGGDAIFGNFIQQILDAKEKGAYKQTSYDPSTGNYNQFWMADREWDNRTSLIIDPPDGQFPPLTAEAQARRAAAAARPRTRGPSDGPEDRPLSERCISYGAPRTGANYNSYTQIIQSPDTVVLLQEMIHDARVVPMTNKPHLPKKIRQLHGDPRGRWEGDTLVVDVTNFSENTTFRKSSTTLHLIERYTRVDPETVRVEVTVDDPTTWTKPWTIAVTGKKDPAYWQILEYACHEGNYGMRNMLSASRAEERAAAKKKR